MSTRYRIPHVTAVNVPRPHVMRVTFDDGVMTELEFVVGGNAGTVFEPLDDAAFFAGVAIDPESRTVVWPNGVDLDPAVLHGDFEPAGRAHFRNVTGARRDAASRG
jgi:hypothetical protein